MTSSDPMRLYAPAECGPDHYPHAWHDLGDGTGRGVKDLVREAAGWRVVGERPARAGWSVPSRPRDDRGVDRVPRTLWEAPA